MFTQHQAFIVWAGSYDSGGITMRSKAKHDQWQKLLPCKVIKLNGSDDLDEIFKAVRRALQCGSE